MADADVEANAKAHADELLKEFKDVIDGLKDTDDSKDVETLREMRYQMRVVKQQIDILINESYDITNAYQDRKNARKAKAEADRLANLRAANAITSLSDLIKVVQNSAQTDILYRLVPSRYADDDSERLYLVDYVPNTSADKRKAHVLGKFTILGAVNAKGARDSYEVSFHKQGAKPCPFWCSCPYHKFKSTKDGTMCKHISFLVVRFAKFFDPLIFENRTLSDEQHAKLLALVSRPLKETSAAIMAASSNLADFAVAADRTFVEDDVCAICYEEFLGPDGTAPDVAKLVGCPVCHQVLHKECLGVWLGRSTSCVYCRTDCYSKYRQLASVADALARVAAAGASTSAAPAAIAAT